VSTNVTTSYDEISETAKIEINWVPPYQVYWWMTFAFGWSYKLQTTVVGEGVLEVLLVFALLQKQ
jgi:hypothetical protein